MRIAVAAALPGAHLRRRHPALQPAQVLRAAHQGRQARHHAHAQQRALQQVSQSVYLVMLHLKGKQPE